MKESNSDAARLEKLLKNYKDKEFRKGLNYISCDGVIIKNSVVRENGINVVKYDVLVDGRRVVLTESLREHVRDVYNRVFYCEPDDTPLGDRFLSWGLYLAFCGALVGAIYGITRWYPTTKTAPKEIKISDINIPDMPRNAFVIKHFERAK